MSAQSRIPGALLALACLAGCQQQQPWNVLLVTFDTTRADRIGSYGNERINTPTLDRLAAEGVRFDQVISAAPITAPSHATIMTGRYPLAHGFRDNGLFTLDDDERTLAEILKAKGYATAAAIGAYPLIERFNLDQGFDLYDDELTGHLENYMGERQFPKRELFFDERRAAQVNEAVLPWLEEHALDPFFLWVHYFDPHQPFDPPPPFDQLYADDLYDGEIAYADSRLGFLLERIEALGVLDRTLVIMTADHGEGLGEHNEVTHAVLAYNATLRVPLIIRPPPGAGHQPGKVVADRVGTVDILPTVLRLLGLPVPDEVQGRSLASLFDAAGASDDLEPSPYYAENLSPSLTHGWGELRVLIDADRKYIHGPRPELYDLGADPDELHNLAQQDPDDVRRMRDALNGFIRRHAAAPKRSTGSIDADVLARLQSLGYLSGGAPDSIEITEQLKAGGIAPQDRVGDINRMSSAKHLLAMQRPAEALVYTEKLVAESPDSPAYVDLHAMALAGVGKLEAAWIWVEHLQTMGKVNEQLVLRLTARQFEQGDRRETMGFLQRSIAMQPTARALWLLASFQERTEDTNAAIETLKEALVLSPEFAPARVDLAVLLAGAGEPAAAEREFTQALEDAPYYAKASYNYGAFLMEGDRLTEAEALFRRALQLAPDYSKARLGLVGIHFVRGERDGAQRLVSELRQTAPGSEELAAAEALLSTL